MMAYSKKSLIYTTMLFMHVCGLWPLIIYCYCLVLTVTSHSCKLPEKPKLITEYEWKSRYIPLVKTPTGEEKFSDCLIYTTLGNNETKACDKFDYDRTWFETTVVSDNNWICEHEINVPNIFAYSRVGEIIGSLCFGWFGDMYGRKLTYIASLAMLIIGRCLSLLASSSFLLFVMGCTIASFPSWSATQSLAVISIEISSPQRRATMLKMELVSISMGMCLMPFFYWWLRSWKLFLIITTASQLVYLVFSWKLIESPQWFWINGKSKKALQNLKHIAKINKTILDPNTERDILSHTHTKHGISESLGPLALFSSWRIGFTTTLQLVMWFAISTNYMVTVMSSGEKSSGNPFLDFAWQSLAEIPGHFIAAYFADRIGRKYTGIASFSLTTLIWILYAYCDITGDTWIKNEWLATILAVVNRSSITVSYYIINLFNVELYPTCLRQSGMSLGNVISGGGSSLAHYILYLKRRVDVRYPSLILIATTLIGGIMSTLFLPETINTKLPETLKDAQNLSSRKSFRNDGRDMVVDETNV